MKNFKKSPPVSKKLSKSLTFKGFETLRRRKNSSNSVSPRPAGREKRLSAVGMYCTPAPAEKTRGNSAISPKSPGSIRENERRAAAPGRNFPAATRRFALLPLWIQVDPSLSTPQNAFARRRRKASQAYRIRRLRSTAAPMASSVIVAGSGVMTKAMSMDC